jgi:hypothetical protein
LAETRTEPKLEYKTFNQNRNRKLASTETGTGTGTGTEITAKWHPNHLLIYGNIAFCYFVGIKYITIYPPNVNSTLKQLLNKPFQSYFILKGKKWQILAQKRQKKTCQISVHF